MINKRVRILNSELENKFVFELEYTPLTNILNVKLIRKSNNEVYIDRNLLIEKIYEMNREYISHILSCEIDNLRLILEREDYIKQEFNSILDIETVIDKDNLFDKFS